MATYFPPKKGIEYILYVSLVDQSNTKLFKSSPTLASGDFQVSIDGGALNALGTTPTVTPSSSKMVKVTLSASEMNGDNITLVCSDAAGAEWCDLTINLQTTARQIDDLAFPVTSGRSMVVDSAGLVDANTVKLGASGSGIAQTGRDIGSSVLISSGTGTGQLDVTSGVIKSNLVQILGTLLTETAGQIAAGFRQFFNIASPTSTMNVITTVGTVSNDVTIGKIKKNTALNNFMFLMLDSTDHVSPKTGLTITSERSINGAAFTGTTNSVTEISNGWYQINLSASDLNGDVIALKFTATGADATNISIVTIG